MKLALIPPIPNLDDFESTGIHLLLAHLFEHPAYVDHYHKRSLEGDYLILDNGAHEGPALEFVHLLRLAGSVRADEVVIPDVPHKAADTIELLQRTIDYLRTADGKYIYQKCGAPNLMFVPQAPADDFLTFLDCATEMHRICFTSQLQAQFVIGVPLMYDHFPAHDLLDVLDRVTWMTEYSHVQIHTLGWSRKLETPCKVSTIFPNVRSIDTAKPFMFARAGIAIDNFVDPVEYPGRSENYFTQPLTAEEIELARHNVETFKGGIGIAVTKTV